MRGLFRKQQIRESRTRIPEDAPTTDARYRYSIRVKVATFLSSFCARNAAVRSRPRRPRCSRGTKDDTLFVPAMADVRWKFFHLLSSFFARRPVSRAPPLPIARRWFVDIFIIPPDDGSMHRADYANATPHLQLFSYVCTRNEHEASINSSGRLKVQRGRIRRTPP